MMTMASSSSNSIQYKKENYRYDVFISFRGPDTRRTFVDHLHDHLLRRGIVVFKDDRELQKGEFIPAQLLQAIQDSRLSIIVFSQNYASSTWCLDEMAAIADCKQQSNQTVFPVFCGVDPSHVRNQNGKYQKAFDSHRSRFREDPDKVDRWARAMTDLGKSAGWDVRNKFESTEIKEIVQEVIKRLKHKKFSGFGNKLIGIESPVEALEGMLELSSNNDNVRVLGIWGMSGIGKTTHAVVLYNNIFYKFDACCFIDNVNETYKDGGATAIQKQVLRQTLDEKNLEIYSPSEISEIIKNRLHNKKVLIVLDNVNQERQFKELAIDPKDLHKGSRVIIITTDEHVLNQCEAHVRYNVSLMNDNDARELFFSKAFKSEDQISSYVELIPEVLKYVQGLPLAIEVIGSFLCSRDATQWKDALDRFENSPENGIMDVLQISVDGLQYEEKEIFLHIACFFKEEREDYAKGILNCCGLHTCIGIQRLIENSFVTLRDEAIHMHDLLQELGKKIVRNQFPGQPGSWSRIWLYEDFFQVMTTQTGTNNVTAVVLNKKDQDMSECSVAELSKMKNLRLLILYHKKFSEKNLDFLSSQLRYLLWHDYPFTSLPSRFEAFYLEEMNMPSSSIKYLWKHRKNFPCLKRMDLSNSKYLEVTPDFSGVPNLERLDLSGCTGLIFVHPSMGSLKNLVFLSFRNCNNLISIKIGLGDNNISLRVLHFSGCTKLENTPDFTGTTNLEYLDFDGCTSLSSVHESIGALEKLTFLSFRDCKNLVSIPDSINTMTSLQTLDLWGCLKLEYLPLGQAFSPSPHLKSLVFLDMGFCNLVTVPYAIGELRCLERLNLQGNNFVSIPYDSLCGLIHLAYLNLSHCHKLEALPNHPSKGTSSGGRYFKMVSGSRDHRSGLYAFDCPKLPHMLVPPRTDFALAWLVRLIEEPCNFRCGFDIIVPWGFEAILPRWLLNQGFKGDSVIRITRFNVDDNWMGFVFCVTFELNINSPAVSSSSPHSSHSFRLSFESEYTEEYFDMSLNLELNKIYGSKHLWVIYISREHCHFVKTGAHITFKAHSSVKINAWGMKSIFRQDVDDLKRMQQGESLPLDPNVVYHVYFEHVEKSNNSGPEFQLPYNWWVTEEDARENRNTKEKETNLSNVGFDRKYRETDSRRHRGTTLRRRNMLCYNTYKVLGNITMDQHDTAAPIATEARSSVIDPGPPVHTLLTLQDKHISTTVWNSQEDPTARDRVLNVRHAVTHDHEAIPEDIHPWLVQAGFYHVACLRNHEIDHHLVSALVERWRPETRTFHMSMGEVTITLEDVHHLLGLPTDGEVVSGTYELHNYREIVGDLLGVQPKERLGLRFLREQFGDYAVHAGTEVGRVRYTRALILRILGGTLFVNIASRFGLAHYLVFLDDFERTGSFSWGSVVLASLYRELCQATRASRRDMGGCALLLQLWAWTRFPSISPDLPAIEDQDEVQQEIYGHRFNVYTTRQARFSHIRRYRHYMDVMRRRQIRWRPYDIVDIVHPVDEDMARRWLAVAPLICFELVVYQQPDRVLRQFGFDQHIPDEPINCSELLTITVIGKSKMDWRHQHEFYIAQWANRDGLILQNLTSMRQDGYLSVNSEYMQWYYSVTRRWMTRRAACNAHVTDHAETIVHMTSPESQAQQAFDMTQVYDEAVRLLAACDDLDRVVDPGDVAAPHVNRQTEAPPLVLHSIRRARHEGLSLHHATPPVADAPIIVPPLPRRPAGTYFTPGYPSGSSQQYFWPPYTQTGSSSSAQGTFPPSQYPPWFSMSQIPQHVYGFPAYPMYAAGHSSHAPLPSTEVYRPAQPTSESDPIFATSIAASTHQMQS